MNVVALVGNLATDVDLKDLDEERKVATFVLAVDRLGDGADFFKVAAWNKQAELCGRYLSKGRQVAVEGRLRSRSWEDDGKRRSAVEVVAGRVVFLSNPGAGPGEEAPFEAATLTG
jgi:single-strand DNA-binding protein